jgi:hypothetical protein
MNCCDEYGDCRQGRDCPVRVAKVGRKDHAPAPLPASFWRAYLKPLAKGMLICIVVLFAAAIATGVAHA